MFMSAAAPTVPSDPPPNRFGRLLGLVRRLLDYGRDLAVSLQQHSTPASLAAATHTFGTRDIALILARIAQGILRATALETRLVPLASRPEPVSQPGLPSSRSPAPRAARTTTPLAQLPTPAQIADAVRRRPVGAVIADICRDLGVTPTHPLWPEVQLAITLHGGNLATLVMDTIEQSFRPLIENWPQPSPPCTPIPAVAATGPP
jgi:hypothetical protein